MKEYTTEFLRNVALVSHGSAGKTMLAESMLFLTGGTTRMGKIEDGSTVSDHDEEEIRRKISLTTSVLPVEYRDHKLNILDAPGFTDFVGEVVSALSVCEAAVVLVEAVSGMEVGTEIAWRYADDFELPRLVVINKLDRDNASFSKAYESVEAFAQARGQRLVKVQLPFGEKHDFKGVIDLISMKAFLGDGKAAREIPAEMQAAAKEAHGVLVEAAAEGEDTLLEKYLENGALSDEELIRGLKKVVQARTLRTGLLRGRWPLAGCRAAAERHCGPAALACAGAHRGSAEGKDGQESLAASDAGPLAAYVWKTTADPFVGKMTYFRVFSGSIQADARVWNQSKGAEERMSGLHVQRGKEQVAVKNIHAGDIGTVAKLTVTATGDTFCDKNHPLTIAVPTYPAALFRVAIGPKTQADAAKISSTLTRLCEEDMTLSWHNEHSTGETVLQGMGDQHIDVAIHRAQTKFQVGLVPREPTSSLPRRDHQEGLSAIPT